MLKNLAVIGLTVVATVAAGAAEYSCRERVGEITRILRDKQFDCESFGRQEACDNICAAVAGPSRSEPWHDGRDGRGPDNRGPGACDPGDLRRVQLETERATLDRVRQDINAEGQSRATAVGADPQDCLNRARSRATAGQYQAVSDCNNQSTYFKNCAIVGERIIQAPTEILPFRGQGHSEGDVRRVSIDECKRNAMDKAREAAVSECRRVTGANCLLSMDATPATHREKAERRYGLFGPIDRTNICDSSAEARPDSSARLQCSVEIYARNRF